MVVRDSLTWILDEPKQDWKQMQKTLSRQEYQEWSSARFQEAIDKRIAFVHSLGLKCDSVGWSNLDLNRPDAGEILDKIEAFCKEYGLLARGYCFRQCEDFESEWYELVLPPAKGIAGYKSVISENGEKIKVKELYAYKEKGNHALFGYGCFFVSEHFRESCIRHNVPGVRFCWARDAGRFASEQYFIIYSDKCLRKIACDRFLRYNDSDSFGEVALEHHPGPELHNRLKALGGKFPRIAEIFYNMQFSLPDYHPVSEMPKEGFVHVHWGQGGHFGRDRLLVHRKTAEILLKEKVICKKNLQPVFLYSDDEIPAGYYVEEMHPIPVPQQSYIDEMHAEYEEFIKKPRPERKTTPKEALKLYRKVKSTRKEHFEKGMKKELVAALEETAYAPLASYYLIANGGNISDEYWLMPYTNSVDATAEFIADMAKEELVEIPAEGIVIASCADGDRVILCADGTVSRVSHEVPEVTEDWPTLAQFFADCIELDE